MSHWLDPSEDGLMTEPCLWDEYKLEDGYKRQHMVGESPRASICQTVRYVGHPIDHYQNDDLQTYLHAQRVGCRGCVLNAVHMEREGVV